MRKLSLFALGLLLAASSFAQKVKTPKEAQALQEMFGSQDPDDRIKKGEAFIVKFADSEFKSTVLYLMAASAEQKNDFEKMVIYCEETIKADPKNYMTMLMLSRGIAQRTKEFDLDKDEKLARADKLAKDAGEILKTATKPNPQMTDDQWAAAKKDFIGQSFEALGMIAMVRKKYDDAVTNFKAALDAAAQPDPATMVRLASAYNNSNKPDEALALIEKVSAMPDLHPAIRQVAGQEKLKAAQLKAAKK